MKFTELKQNLNEGVSGIFLLEGDDAYFLSHGEQAIKSAYLTMPELNFTSFDGETLKGSALTELTSALQSFPFMAEKRVVRVIDFYPSESDYDKYLAPTFENLPQTTVCIIVNHGSKKGVADLKKKKCVHFVDCNKSDEETVTRWAYVTLKRAGIVADVGLCTLIAQYCLCDMARVSAEVEKIKQYKQGGTLTKAEVDALVYRDAEYRIYELTNAISRKNYGAFCEIAADLQTKGFDHTALLSSLFSYFKNLLTCLCSHQSDGELASTLKMKEYGVKKMREQATVFGAKRLTYFVEQLYQNIANLKCGNLTPANAWQCACAQVFFAE